MPRNISTQLPEVVTTKLREFARGQIQVAVLRGLAESLLAFGIGIAFLALLQWVVHPSLPVRIWLSGINYFVTGLCLIFRVGVPLMQSAPLAAIARALEKAANNRFQERILSAVEMADAQTQPGVSSWMVSKTIDLAANEISNVNPREFINHAPACVAWKRAGWLVLVLAAACVIPGMGARTWLALNPYASTAPLSRLKLLVTPGNTRLKQGTPLDIKVSAKPLPEQVKAAVQWEDGFKETVLLSRSGTNGDFVLSLPAVTQGFRYSVQAEDAETAVFTVKVDVPPRIGHIQLEIQPPAYTGFSNRVVEGGSADFLSGSQVRIRLEPAGEKISSADWLAEGAGAQKFVADKNALTLDLQPTNIVSYSVRLTGENQLRSEPSQKWSLRPLADLPPVVKLTTTGLESGMVQSDEILPLQALAADDVGLKRVDLVVLGKDSEADVKNLFDKGATNVLNSRELKTSLNYELAEIKALTGEEVQLQLAAMDVRGQVTRSEPISFTIGSRAKTLEAQLAARLKDLVGALEAQLDYVRQTRGSWLSISRNYKDDDPASEGPALTVLKSRLNEFGREIGGIAARLISESETNHIEDSRFMYMLGTSMTAWGSEQRDVLLIHCAKLGQTNDSSMVFNQGRELFSLCLKDLERYRRVVSVLEEALETDVLATRCESAQGRYKRGLPVLYGNRANPANSQQNGAGLTATFFEGIELSGRVLEQKIAMPRFDNYAPGGRRENWSARYEGDINIPEAGDWMLQCISDDGVRLKVDGKSLLSQDAWRPHAAGPYNAELKLANGWHPLIIEFFQGAGECKLQFLAAKKGQAPAEVPASWLRAVTARQPKPAIETNALLSAIANEALKDRIRSSLQMPTVAPLAVGPMTNDVDNEQLPRLVREKSPVGELLSRALTNYPNWKPEESLKPESQADELTAFSMEARRILRDELNKYRWQFEGAQALKQVHAAIEELREITRELHQLPYNKGDRTEQEQAKIDLAKAWEAQLQRATAEAEHHFFEIAKQQDATVAERVTALNAATKAEKDFKPAVDRMASTLEESRNKHDMGDRMDQRLEEISRRYRELDEMQNKINYEQVAADARKALPAVRAFERAQKANNATAMAEKFPAMKEAVAQVQKDERVIGDYDSADKLERLSAQTPQQAKGKETTDEIRGRASSADNNPPSLAETIPPPMRDQANALEKQKATPQESAQALARPRLAMALEAARNNMQGDRRTAVAYQLLGQDTGELLQSPESITPQAIRPLADRAAALAGQKGEEARQKELKAAEERMAAMKRDQPANEQAIASQLDELSSDARQAADQEAKRDPLTGKLGEMEHQGQPVPDWAESTDAREIAASAAHESMEDIKSAPKQWDSYNTASQILADAARQIRMDAALNQMADLNPFAMPENPAREAEEALRAAMESKAKLDGAAGRATHQLVPKGIDQAEWARLTERLRQGIRGSGIENFSEEQQAAIRAYFEKLGSEK